MAGLRVWKIMESLSSPPPNRRCWFLIRPDYFVAEPHTVIEALRKHPMVTRVDWSAKAPTAAVHLIGPAVDYLRAHIVLLEALLSRLPPPANNQALIFPLALYDFHSDSRLRTFISLRSLTGMPIYLRVRTGADPAGPLVVAIHRPNPHTDLIFQVLPDCPAGEWAGLSTETLEAGTPISPQEFYAALSHPEKLADSLRWLNG
jgi:hypothetical protein